MRTLKLEEIISDGTSFLILYGTQLGNAQSIAEGLFDTAVSEHFLNPKLIALNELSDIAEFARVNCPVVIVTSTTGDGEAPENADKFLRKLRRRLLKPNLLASIKYTILGLGDTNFNNFCNCGKLIHKRLEELGAQTFYNPAWADDAVGLDLTVEPWIENLWSSLKSAVDASGGLSVNSEEVKKSPNPIKRLLEKMSSSNKAHVNEVGDTSRTETQMVSLTLPSCPVTSLAVDYKEKLQHMPVDLIKPPATYPLLEGDPFLGSIVDGKLLTSGTSEKTTVELTVKLDKDIDFEPGDAVGIVCPNSSYDVEILLEKLNLQKVADMACTFSTKPGSKGKFPIHIPREASLRQILLWYCDIRTPPKKALLRLLAENTSDETEKATLLELCSKQGAALYEQFIRTPSTSILDLLLKFPTCKPKIESLIEHLPRLSPRPYSISSSPLVSSDTFTIAFSIIKFLTSDTKCSEFRKFSRLGVCTGWLYGLGKQHIGNDTTTSLGHAFEYLKIGSGGDDGDKTQDKIVFYKRKNHYFRLPKSLDSSVVMLGPGTGVAPFIGFIQHRLHQKVAGKRIGKMCLYFGCRHKDQDFLYKETLDKFTSIDDQLIHVFTSFSRDNISEQGDHIKYVQDMLYKNRQDVVSALLDEKAYFFVCGDAKNMAKNVREKLILCIQDVKGLSEKEAMEKVSELVAEKRYLQDVWS